MAQIIILMGVSGSGKTAVGEALSTTLAWPFTDGDAFHPPQNVHKMAAGIPLTDDDRRPWLQNLHDLIAHSLAHDNNAIIACSALKQAYRDILLNGNPNTFFVYLRGDYDLILKRMETRGAHFFKPEMLASQFTTLEEPANCLVINISLSIPEIVASVEQYLGE